MPVATYWKNTQKRIESKYHQVAKKFDSKFEIMHQKVTSKFHREITEIKQVSTNDNQSIKKSHLSIINIIIPMRAISFFNSFLKNNRKNYTFKVIAIYQELETQDKTCKYLFQ